MEQSEIPGLVVQLIAILRQQKLGWVIRQVAQSLTDEDVAEFDDEQVDQILNTRDDSSGVLQHLLSAVNILVVETGWMEQSVRNFFMNENKNSRNNQHINPNDYMPRYQDAIMPALLYTEPRRETFEHLAFIIKPFLLGEPKDKLSVTEFIHEFSKGLSAAWDAADLNRKKGYSLYELYILKLIAESASAKGACISYKDGKGESFFPPLFRTGPHQICDEAYIYTELKFPSGRIFEIHTGVKFCGKSGVEHECDLALIRRGTAHNCRRQKKHPKHSNSLLSVECKFYTANIRLGMSREFVGLTTDLTVPKKQNIFVTSSALVDNGRKLLNHHSKKAVDELVPGNTAKEDEFRELLNQVFDGFITK